MTDHMPYRIQERVRSGEYEPETNHFFDVIDTRTNNTIMVFQQEAFNPRNRPRGDWTYWLTYNVEKVTFSPDKHYVLFYVKGKQHPGRVLLPA